ncbi:MAG: lysophospholipid acyltransferase family protein [Deltaproteobacteria bacterium]|nr:lysophospholipid acyltransferase family protein [Candidatus Anaeroferrophillus wilburensis]MBN2889055.1 lysophospholipid acyltransferase family protein [Deltaproteobacteria bacterium]
MKKLGDWLLLRVVPLLASLVIRGLSLLIRIDYLGMEYWRQCRQDKRGVIISFWHDQLLLMVKGNPSKAGARILISASKDGELIARTMRYFGHDAVRGSSSRGGKEALKEMVLLAQEPGDLAITPDGPRGPRHRLKPGVAQLARLTGRPVLPLAFACSRGRRFQSWDRFLLPYPFSRGVFVLGEPVVCQPGEELALLQERLSQAMEHVNEKARAHLRCYGLSAV